MDMAYELGDTDLSNSAISLLSNFYLDMLW